MIKRFQKKPTFIKAVEFNPKAPRERYVGLCRVETDGGVSKVFNELHNSWIEVKNGDWIRVDDYKDTYPIDSEYMKENYVPA